MSDINIPLGGSEQGNNNNNGAPPAKRRRTGLACTICRQRKTKCDGAQPQCSSCQYLDLDCSYGGSTQGSKLQSVIVKHEDYVDLQRRLAIVEKKLSHLPEPALSQSSSAAQAHNPSLSPTNSTQAVSSMDAMGNLLRVASYDCPLPESSPAALSNSILNALHVTTGSDGLVVSNTPTSLHHARSIVQSLDNLTAALPSLDQGVAMLDKFRSMTWALYPFVHVQTVVGHYQRIMAIPEPRQTSGLDVSWLGLIYGIFALVCGVQSRFEEASAFYDQTLRILNVGTFAERDHLLQVQTLLIAGLYTQGRATSEDAWHLVGRASRIAIALRYHTGRPILRNNHENAQLAGRTWIALSVIDSFMCMTLGRPVSIPQLAEPPIPPVAFPDESQSDFDCLLANSGLSQILQQILQAFWSGTAEFRHGALAEDLARWSEQLPASLHVPSDPALASQIALTIRLKHLAVRMQLYRPILCRSINDKDQPAEPRFLFADINSSLEENTIQGLASCSVDALATVHILLGTCTDTLWRKTGASWFRLFYAFNALNVLAGSLVCKQLDSEAIAFLPGVPSRADRLAACQSCLTVLYHLTQHSENAVGCYDIAAKLVKSIQDADIGSNQTMSSSLLDALGCSQELDISSFLNLDGVSDVQKWQHASFDMPDALWGLATGIQSQYN